MTADRHVLIADDHPLFRSALDRAVRRAVSEYATRHAETLSDALAMLQEIGERTSLALLDIHMPDSQGFAGLIQMRQRWPDIPVIVVSGSETPEVISKAVEFGAAGFIPKSTELPVIVTAIEAVLAGDSWLPPDIDLDSGGSDMAQRLSSLTPAQLKVLTGLSVGRLNKQIAYDMGISEATVKAHVTAILRKLGVVNRTQAVLAAKAMEIGAPEVEGAAR